MAVAFDVHCAAGLSQASTAASSVFRLLFMHKNQSYDELLTVPHLVVDTANLQLVLARRSAHDAATRFRLVFTPEAVAHAKLLDTSPLNRTLRASVVLASGAAADWLGCPDRSGVYVDPNHSSNCQCAGGCRCVKGATRVVELQSSGQYSISAPYSADERRRHGYLPPNATWQGTMTSNDVTLRKVSSEHRFVVQYLMMANQTVLQWHKPHGAGLVNQWLKTPVLYPPSVTLPVAYSDRGIMARSAKLLALS